MILSTPLKEGSDCDSGSTEVHRFYNQPHTSAHIQGHTRTIMALYITDTMFSTEAGRLRCNRWNLRRRKFDICLSNTSPPEAHRSHLKVDSWFRQARSLLRLGLGYVALFLGRSCIRARISWRHHERSAAAVGSLIISFFKVLGQLK